MNNPFSLHEKNILITGASSGIGRQCALLCSLMGANVILVARNEERLKQTFLQLHSGSHFYYSQDTTQYNQLESIIKKSVNKLGKIDGFIHSAGIEKTIPLKMMKPEIYRELFDVNVISGFEIAKILSKKKYSNNDASFVFIASIMGILGQSGKVGYCCSKGALIAGMKAMALELANKNIRVNCISPAIVETEMTKKLFENLSKHTKETISKMHPLGFGKPEDVANACIYLLSNASRWITGTNMIIDGGYSAH